MPEYDGNCTFPMNWSDFPGMPCLIFELDKLNAVQTIETVLVATCNVAPLGA
jgi:hypothetical protein